MDLLGEFRHKIDAKGRLSLPAKFRREISDDLVITIDPRRECLYVFETKDFNDWVKSFFEADGGFDPGNVNHVDARSELKRRGSSVEVDTSGRINIPANQREEVGIDKDVVLIGNDGYFEIWDAAARDKRNSSVDLAAMLFG